jgi:(p)ppGpp synthase/HD superfamily hydrolase
MEMMMTTKNELALAEEIARDAHTNQVDATGHDYILHVERVVARVSGDKAKAAAWLHDVVEDTDITLEYLASVGISAEVVAAVRKLTRPEGFTTYGMYISVLATSGDELAIEVKRADLADHLETPGLPLSLKPRYERAVRELAARGGFVI